MPFATTPAGRISYTVTGPSEPTADSQTLLMIMGLAGSGAMWWRLLPQITRRHRAIVFDNRGTGASSRANPGLTMTDMVGDAVAVLNAAGVHTTHVMGMSMGGMIAQHLALDHRERVCSLVLGCTSAGGRREAPNTRLMAAMLLRPVVGPSRTFPLVAPALYSRHTRTNERKRLHEDMRIRARDHVEARTPLLQAAAIAGHDTRARLHELEDVPTLVIHGLEDQLISPERGRELAQLIPGSRLIEIPGAGHLLATDAEQEVATKIVEHLDSHDDSSTPEHPVRVDARR